MCVGVGGVGVWCVGGGVGGCTLWVGVMGGWVRVCVLCGWVGVPYVWVFMYKLLNML